MPSFRLHTPHRFLRFFRLFVARRMGAFDGNSTAAIGSECESTMGLMRHVEDVLFVILGSESEDVVDVDTDGVHMVIGVAVLVLEVAGVGITKDGAGHDPRLVLCE